MKMASNFVSFFSRDKVSPLLFTGNNRSGPENDHRGVGFDNHNLLLVWVRVRVG